MADLSFLNQADIDARNAEAALSPTPNADGTVSEAACAAAPEPAPPTAAEQIRAAIAAHDLWMMPVPGRAVH
jgi:hypothetical protein